MKGCHGRDVSVVAESDGGGIGGTRGQKGRRVKGKEGKREGESWVKMWVGGQNVRG